MLRSRLHLNHLRFSLCDANATGRGSSLGSTNSLVRAGGTVDDTVCAGWFCCVAFDLLDVTEVA